MDARALRRECRARPRLAARGPRDEPVGIGIVGAGGIFEQHARALVELSRGRGSSPSAMSTRPRLRAAAARYPVPIRALTTASWLTRPMSIWWRSAPRRLPRDGRPRRAGGRQARDLREAAGAYARGCGSHHCRRQRAARPALGRLPVPVSAGGPPDAVAARLRRARPAALGALSSLRALSAPRQAAARRLVGPVGRRRRRHGDDPAHSRARPDVPVLRSPGAGLGGRRHAEGGDRVRGHLRRGGPVRGRRDLQRHSTMSAHRSSAGFDVFGTLGSAHSPWSFECLDRDRRAELRQRRARWRARRPAGRRVRAHTPYLASVLDALEAAAPLPSGPEQARLSLELATAIYASSLAASRSRCRWGRRTRTTTGCRRAEYAARRGSRLRREVAVSADRASPSVAVRGRSRALPRALAPGAASDLVEIARYARRDVNTLAKGEGPIAEFEARFAELTGRVTPWP